MPSLTKDRNLAKGDVLMPFSNVSFQGIIVPAISLPALTGGRTAGNS